VGVIITGVVVRGDRRGTGMGFPTANVRLPIDTWPPGFGVYAGFVDGRPAAISVGVRPTFGTGFEPVLEAHILDFSDDLYGLSVRVELLQRIRGELSFGAVAELVEQMHNDVDEVRTIIARTRSNRD
jgi:riboflavin kinase/FMN adenylyltransferase